MKKSTKNAPNLENITMPTISQQQKSNQKQKQSYLKRNTLGTKQIQDQLSQLQKEKEKEQSKKKEKQRPQTPTSPTKKQKKKEEEELKIKLQEMAYQQQYENEQKKIEFNKRVVKMPYLFKLENIKTQDSNINDHMVLFQSTIKPFQFTDDKIRFFNIEMRDSQMVLKNQNIKFSLKVHFLGDRPKYDWLIEDILFINGKGLYSKIFLATDRNTHEKYAVKFIDLIPLNEYELKEVLYEMFIHTQINNININNQCFLRIYDQYIVDNMQQQLSKQSRILILVFQICECSLEDILQLRISQKKPWTSEEIKSIAFDLLDVIFILEEENIYHRDIKPKSILYSLKENRYKISGFDQAKIVLKFQHQNITKSTPHTIAGTQAFMSPQLYDLYAIKTNECHYNLIANDLYSLGLILLLMRNKTPQFNSRIEIENAVNEIQKLIPTNYEIKQAADITTDAIIAVLTRPNASTRLSQSKKLYTELLSNKQQLSKYTEYTYVQAIKKTQSQHENDIFHQQLLILAAIANAQRKIFIPELAKNKYSELLSLAKRKGHDLSLAEGLNQMCSTLVEMGEYQEALKIFQESHQIRIKMEHENKSEENKLLLAQSLVDFHNLSLLIPQQQQTAEIYAKNALQIVSDTFGNQNVQLAYYLTVLGHFYENGIKSDFAIQFFKDAIQIASQYGGTERLSVPEMYFNLCHCLIMSQQFEEAQKILLQGLEWINGEEPIKIDYQQHILAFQKVKQLFLLLINQLNQHLLYVLMITINIKLKQINDENQKQAQEMLEFFRSIYGNEHWRCSAILNKLGFIEYYQKNFSQSNFHFQESIMLIDKKINKLQLQTFTKEIQNARLECLIGLSNVQIELGDYQYASDSLIKALDLFQTYKNDQWDLTLCKENDFLLEIYEKLVFIFEKCNKMIEVQQFSKLLENQKQYLKSHSPQK